MSEIKENFCQENWRRPVRSIKLLVKKRARKTDDEQSSRILQARNVNAIHESLPAGQLKRRNPFGCSASKKANVKKHCENEETIRLFSALDQSGSRNVASVITQETLKQKSECQDLGENINSCNEDNVEVCIGHMSGKRLPVDWSLKSKVCFTSIYPFNWCTKMLGKQEARGVINFVQCEDPHSKVNSTSFQQNIMYWIHPTLPWLSLFPRLLPDVKLTSKVPNVAENQDIANALQSSWSQSFRSLFNLLRSGYCDYFYLCSAQFTVLFRAAMIDGVSSTSAFITPTTKGIREGFDKAGILYTLPVLDARNMTSSDDEENDLLNNDIGDETSWLESIGVGNETLPQLQQSKITQQRAKLRNIDHQGSSLAVITGSSHTQALFNYLMNSKILISKTGSHAGIPPTLLSSVAFDGATLQSFTAKPGVIKQGKNLEKVMRPEFSLLHDYKQKYSLDITGPILPGNFFKLCQLFESTQQRQFSCLPKTLQATAPFNVLSSDMQEEPDDGDNSFLKPPSNLGTTSLTFIKCDDDLYSWETS